MTPKGVRGVERRRQSAVNSVETVDIISTEMKSKISRETQVVDLSSNGFR